MQSAQVAAKALDGEIPVTVIDSKTVSMGLGSQCVAACAMASEGADLATIAARAEQMAQRTRLLGALDTLEHLRRGGRIGGAQAMLGSMLSIKPVIEVRDGVVAESAKVRTRSKSLVHLAEKLAAAPDPQDVYVFHAQAPDIDEFLERVEHHRAARPDRARRDRSGDRHAHRAAHDRAGLGRRRGGAACRLATAARERREFDQTDG